MLPFTRTKDDPRRLRATGVVFTYIIDGVTEDDGVEWHLTVLDERTNTMVDSPYMGPSQADAWTVAAVYETLHDVPNPDLRGAWASDIAGTTAVRKAVEHRDETAFVAAVAAARRAWPRVGAAQ